MLNVLILLAVVGQDPDMEIEGDAALFRQVVDIQKSNLTRYPHGSLTAKVTEKYRDGSGTTIDDTFEVSLQWSGSKTYWSFTGTNASNTKKSVGRSEHAGRRIRDEDRTIVYLPDAKQVQVSSQRLPDQRPEFALRPDTVWYHWRGLAPWHEILAPTRNLATRKGKYAARREGDLAILEWRDGDPASEFRVEASFEFGGNIVAFESREGDTMRSHGSYAWENDGQKRTRLKRCESSLWSISRQVEMQRDYTLEIGLFDPDTVPDESRFEMDSLEISKGTPVSEFGTDGQFVRRYRYGEE